MNCDTFFKPNFKFGCLQNFPWACELKQKNWLQKDKHTDKQPIFVDII